MRGIKKKEGLFFVTEQPWMAGKGIQAVTHPAMLLKAEGLWWLDETRLDQVMEKEMDRLLTICDETAISMAALGEQIKKRRVFLVNSRWFSEETGGWETIVEEAFARERIPEVDENEWRAPQKDGNEWGAPKKDGNEPGAPKKIVHILALGDVGGTVLLGLQLLGGAVIGHIGVWDQNPAMSRRFACEMNQTAYPWAYDRLPEVVVLEEEQLFDCDVLIFCASKGVPQVGTPVADVRLAQFSANRELMEYYGKMARERQFSGLFAVVSDPVDPLCKAVFLASNQGADGNFDGLGLRPEQIQGYGLGVMNSRAAYYAKQDPALAMFLTEGRAYGPHGQDLVIANSIDRYEEACSCRLTALARDANLRIREWGFKPYLAPALSSAAISVLLTIEGKWHYSSNYLGGVFMGCKNRTHTVGVELEHLFLPEPLYRRLEHAYEGLEAIV